MLIKMTEMALATALVVGAASAALAWKDGDHKSGGYHPGVPPPAPAVVPTAAPVAALALPRGARSRWHLRLVILPVLSLRRQQVVLGHWSLNEQLLILI